jgi:hypothetical protein
MSSQRGLIAARAYELWRLRGNPEGSPEVDWYQAEKEILGRVNDAPSELKVTLDSLQQDAADVSASGSDRGPTDSDTHKTLPDDSSQSAPSSRNGGRRSRANGQTDTR